MSKEKHKCFCEVLHDTPESLYLTADKYLNTLLPGAPGTMANYELQHLDKAVSAFKSGKHVELYEFVHKNQWNYFVKQTEGIEGYVDLWGPIPDDWNVDRKKHISVSGGTSRAAVEFVLAKKKQFPFLGYKRDVQLLDKHFLSTYGGLAEVDRECIMQVLERLKVLDQSVYSRPDVAENLQKHIQLDYIFPIPNNHAKYRNIENTHKEGTTEKLKFKIELYDHNNTVPVLYEMAKRVHCYAVLDCFPFNNDLLGVPTEKWVWPVFMGIPFIYIGSKRQLEVLRSWGIEPNDPYRGDVRGVAEQMMWLKSIFNDPELAQKWQESQGELIIKNREALDRLPDLLKAGNWWRRKWD